MYIIPPKIWDNSGEVSELFKTNASYNSVGLKTESLKYFLNHIQKSHILRILSAVSSLTSFGKIILSLI